MKAWTKSKPSFEIGRIQWDGDNTDDVVSFCCHYDNTICRQCSIYTSQLSGNLTLSIEPADIMRNHSVDIEIEKCAIAFDRGSYMFVKSEDDA